MRRLRESLTISSGVNRQVKIMKRTGHNRWMSDDKSMGELQGQSLFLDRTPYGSYREPRADYTANIANLGMRHFAPSTISMPTATYDDHRSYSAAS